MIVAIYSLSFCPTSVTLCYPSHGHYGERKLAGQQSMHLIDLQTLLVWVGDSTVPRASESG